MAATCRLCGLESTVKVDIVPGTCKRCGHYTCYKCWTGFRMAVLIGLQDKTLSHEYMGSQCAVCHELETFL